MVKRAINLLKLLSKNQSAFLFGPRGVGKTRLSNDFLEFKQTSFSLDLLSTDTYTRYLKDPGLFYREVKKKG